MSNYATRPMDLLVAIAAELGPDFRYSALRGAQDNWTVSTIITASDGTRFNVQVTEVPR